MRGLALRNIVNKKNLHLTVIATTMIYILNFIYLSPEKKYIGTHIAEEEEEDVIRNCLISTETNRSVFSSPVIVDMYSDYVTCLVGAGGGATPSINVIKSAVNEADGSLHISSQVQTVKPSWSDDCSLDSLQGTGGEKLLYMILIKDRGKAGVERRSTIRRLWAAALPSGQRYVFVTSAGDAGADLEAERLLYDDVLQLDLLPSDLYSEHKALLLSLYFSLSRCRSVQHTVLLDQNVLVNPTAMERLSDREATAANRVYGLMYRNFSPARHRKADHFTSRAEWPWELLPALLDRHVMMFSQDTLPLVLHHANTVPVFKHPEIWLSSLICLKAGIIRVGLKDWFSLLPVDGRGEMRGWDCHTAAVWSLHPRQSQHVQRYWGNMLEKTTCPPPTRHNEGSQCKVSIKP